MRKAQTKRDLHPFLLHCEPIHAAELRKPQKSWHRTCLCPSALLPCGAHRLPGFCARGENETGFLLGSEQIPGFTTTAGTPLSLGGNVAFSFDYARRLKGERTGLFVEVPFAAAPSHRGGSSQPGTTTSLATLYIVPSIRLQAFADRRFFALAFRRFRLRLAADKCLP
jgi:hypothetical protein